MDDETLDIIIDYLEEDFLPEVDPRHVELIDDIIIDDVLEITPSYQLICDFIDELTSDLPEVGSNPIDITTAQVYAEWRWKQR